MENPHLILGVSKNATLEDIKKAFRGLARKYHPDTAPDGGNIEKFRAVCEAYECLTKPKIKIVVVDTQSDLRGVDGSQALESMLRAFGVVKT